MKKLAYIHPTYESEIIHVNKALRLKESEPFEWEQRDFYDLVKLRPMRPRHGKNGDVTGRTFAYRRGNGGGNHSNGSMGIAHELVQEYLCRRKHLKVKVYGKEFDVEIEDADDEVLICDPDNNNRRGYIDCVLTLHSQSPNINLFGRKIAIEVTDTHENTSRKIELFRRNEMTAFELKIISDWHIGNEEEVTSHQIERLRKRISGFLDSRFYVKSLHCENRI